MNKLRSFLLSEQERSLLLSWLESPALTKAMAHRVRIVLASADGNSVRVTARKLGVSADTVFLWRRRFQLEGLDGLRSRSLPGRPRRIGRRREGAILAAAQAVAAAPGKGGTGARPSVASVARASGVSRTTVRRLWRERAATAVGADGTDALRPLPAVEPGTIVGIYLDHSFRLMVRVPGPANEARPDGPRRASQTETGAPGVRADGAGALLTAFEGFSPNAQARASAASSAAAGARQATQTWAKQRSQATPATNDGALAFFLRRLTRTPSPRLEIAGEPWPRAWDDAWCDVPAAQRGHWRLLRARTRGEWLSTVARWIAGAPAAQERALAGALGHLTDYFATWRDGSGAFVWTDGVLQAPFKLSPAARPRTRGRPEPIA